MGQQETEVTVTPTKGAEPCPTPSMSQQEFEEKHKTVDATITLTVGTSITCYVVGGKLFLTSPSKVMLPGVQAENAKPLLMYAGGSWISESAKATQFKHTSIFHFSDFEDKTKVLDNNQQLRHRNFSAKQPMKTRLLSSGLNPKMRWYLKLGFHFSMNFHQYECFCF